MTDDVQVDGTLVNLDGSLSVGEAAAALGVSERTVRRRIKDGILSASKLPTTQGYEWRVHLDSVSTRQPVKVDGDRVQVPGSSSGAVQGELSTSPAGSGSELRLALELAEQLRRDNAALVARNEQMAGQLGFTQAKLQEAEKQIALLMPPNEEPAEAEQSTAPGRRSWWRRLLGD